MERYQIESQLIQHGHRLTAARRTVIDALLTAGGHISADRLYEQLKANGEQVGRMTVFRTLDLLVEVGLIRPVYQGDGAAHYILLRDGHHHHLVCTSCNKHFEFDECNLHDLSERLSAQFNFKVAGHLIEIYGTCADCSHV